MNSRSIVRIGLLAALWAGVFWSFASAQALTVPPGFEISEFATRWLSAGRVHGRPVDVTVGPHGDLVMFDDDGDRIYKIRWVRGGK